MLLIAGLTVIIIGALLLNKANIYNKEVRTPVKSKSTNPDERSPDHWHQVEVSRSSTDMFIYAIGIIIVGIAMIALSF
mgnify:CR=1 FL=1